MSIYLNMCAFRTGRAATLVGMLLATPTLVRGQESVTRTPQDRPTIHAVRVPNGSVKLDGHLDEELYQTLPPFTEFFQMEPKPGEPATEKTELWIIFDDKNVYVSVRCWDSQPESRWVLNEMRRDNPIVTKNENVGFIVDTFFDHSSAVSFQVNAIGGVWDGEITNDGSWNGDYNPVWNRKVGRFPDGWTAEMEVPFRSLRYKPGSDQVWGFNLRRTIRWKSEEIYPLKMPLIGITGNAALGQISSAMALLGIEVPAASKNLEVKPYALSSLTTDRLARPALSKDLAGNLGFDVKYGLARNLAANFTYHTDFAQVEVDSQQVNLTRFSLFYPEKRDFFLERLGIFDFGGASAVYQATGQTPLLFFSRRIGLDSGRVVPIDVGGRLTGRVGPYTIGLIDVRTGDDVTVGTPLTNFSVVRLKRDIFRRSSVGILFTGRSNSSVADGSAESFGADARLRPHEFITINTYLAKTATPGVHGNDTSERLDVAYASDRYGLELDELVVGHNFKPDVGYLQRSDYHRTYGVARFSPRPKSMPSVRRFTYQGSYDQYVNSAGERETRDAGALFTAEMKNDDSFTAKFNRRYELLVRPFAVVPALAIPPGGYTFQQTELAYSRGPLRRVAGTVSVTLGSFYGGDLTSVGYTSGRLVFTRHFATEPGVSINWIDLPQGRATSSVLSNRVTYAFTPSMFFSGFVQYNSTARTFGSNLRLRWEYAPGSELFVVYTDELNTAVSGHPELRNRAFVVKANRLVRF